MWSGGGLTICNLTPQSFVITDAKAADFRHKVYLPITITEVIQYFLMGLGALFILVALLLLILTANKKKNDLELRVNEVNQI